MTDTDSLTSDLERFREKFSEMKSEIQKAIVGYDELLTDVLVAVFAKGHVLLEGVPGLGKTYLVQTLSRSMGLLPGRIQCTPDLMPADILGTHIVNENDDGRRVMHFERGPVFANLILVDEINRATPKTQAALLEVMQEGAVTAGGETLSLPKPFFVMATQNPMEMEGTYPLPEAQADRFLFKLKVPFPDQETLIEISKRTSAFDSPELAQVIGADELIEFQKILAEIPVADHVTEFAAKIVLGTHPEEESSLEGVNQYVSYGASPRGMQALIRGARIHCALDGRIAVSIEDVVRVALPS
ncbi:MAG: AAA family ATPase, partial [Verrucomicrobiota bacterium]